MGRRTEDINWIATPEIAREIVGNRAGDISVRLLAVRMLALDVFEYPNIDGSIEYLFRFEKGTGRIIEGQQALHDIEAMMKPDPMPTEFRYCIPGILMAVKAHAPINRLMSKMDRLGDVSTQRPVDQDVVNVTVLVPAKNLKRAQKVDAELRSLIRNGA